MKYAIVTTTIHVPVLLEKYVLDAQKYKRDCFFVVIGDKKTPPQTKTYCEKLAKKYRVSIEYYDVDDQIVYLKKFPELGRHIPYNCIQRRNIGIVRAYEKGADVFITIDDDNYLESKDFIGMHSVGAIKTLDTFSSDTKWFNVCDFLKEKENRRFYHRGFHPGFRFKNEKIAKARKSAKIVANAGLWLEAPDLDAITWIYYDGNPLVTTTYTRKESFMLERGTWSPFNSQNASLAREAIPAYFLSPYAKRYDDIWGSYVIKRIADHLGHAVSFGLPLVRQKRNPHNYWNDLIGHEMMGWQLTDTFIKILTKTKLKGKTYAACYRELADAFTREIPKLTIKDDEHEFLNHYLTGMRVWIKTFERLR